MVTFLTVNQKQRLVETEYYSPIASQTVTRLLQSHRLAQTEYDMHLKHGNRG